MIVACCIVNTVPASWIITNDLKNDCLFCLYSLNCTCNLMKLCWLHVHVISSEEHHMLISALLLSILIVTV